MTQQFSQRHYRTIADWIERFHFSNPEEKLGFITFISQQFRLDNDRFDRVRFMKACGVGEEINV